MRQQQCFSVRNDATGWAELVERLRGLSISAIGLEASGGYERGAMRALLAAYDGFNHCRAPVAGGSAQSL
jgi:transposase